jgi:hypothetical protein
LIAGIIGSLLIYGLLRYLNVDLLCPLLERLAQLRLPLRLAIGILLIVLLLLPIYFVGELVHQALLLTSRVPIAILDLIDRKTPDGTIGIIGFVILSAALYYRCSALGMVPTHNDQLGLLTSIGPACLSADPIMVGSSGAPEALPPDGPRPEFDAIACHEPSGLLPTRQWPWRDGPQPLTELGAVAAKTRSGRTLGQCVAFWCRDRSRLRCLAVVG